MIPVFATLAKSLTGKVALGVAVATLGVGAAAAAGAEMPTLTSAGAAEETDEPSEELLDADIGEEPGGDQVGDETENTESEDTESEDTESEDTESEDTEEFTHGAVVSEFTQGTELVGCEKGQATAAVARGDVDPSSPTLTDDLAPYLAKCGETDEAESDGDESDDADGAEWKDVRDDAKAEWHHAKDEYVAACGDDDDDDSGDGEAEGGGDGADGRSPECDAMKAELKQLHSDGKDEWKAARDAEHAERKADRAEHRAEKVAAKSADKGKSGEGKSGKG